MQLARQMRLRRQALPNVRLRVARRSVPHGPARDQDRSTRYPSDRLDGSATGKLSEPEVWKDMAVRRVVTLTPHLRRARRFDGQSFVYKRVCGSHSLSLAEYRLQIL